MDCNNGGGANPRTLGIFIGIPGELVTTGCDTKGGIDEEIIGCCWGAQEAAVNGIT